MKKKRLMGCIAITTDSNVNHYVAILFSDWAREQILTYESDDIY